MLKACLYVLLFVASGSLKIKHVQCRLIGTKNFLSIPVECHAITIGVLESIKSQFQAHVNQNISIVGGEGIFLGTPLDNDFIVMDFIANSVDNNEHLSQTDENVRFTIPYQMQAWSSRLVSVEEKVDQLLRDNKQLLRDNELAAAERDFCQVLDRIYETIFLDLKLRHGKKYRHFNNLSSILSAVSLSRQEKGNDIIDSLQAISDESNRSSATEFWRNIRAAKRIRNSEQYYDLLNSAAAIKAVEIYASARRQSPKSSTDIDIGMLENKIKHLVHKYKYFDE